MTFLQFIMLRLEIKSFLHQTKTNAFGGMKIPGKIFLTYYLVVSLKIISYCILDTNVR